MNAMKKQIYIIFIMLLSAVGMMAQEQVLTGKVTEKLDNGTQEPIIGANVVLVNNQNRYIKGAVTDIDGNYMIQVPSDVKNLKVKATYIGMKAVTVNYNGQTEINFAMESEAMLQEVTVTGNRGGRDGMGISRLEQTSAVQKVDLASIVENSPVTSVEEALQGQVAGLDINLGGDPGARSSIRIRGTSSLSASNEPLIIIDGVPQDVDITDDFNFSTANEEDFGALLNIAPANIESIEVLKDASATAIYGTKGANGVLLINTKRGSMGKTKFSFSSKFTAKREPESIPLLNGAQYVSLMQDAIWNAANAKGINNAANEMNMLFNNPEINYDPNYSQYHMFNNNTDWETIINQTGQNHSHYVSLSGGGDKARFRVAGGYDHQIGTVINQKLDRYTTRVALDYYVSTKIQVSTNFSLTYTENKRTATSSGGLADLAYEMMPNLAPYEEDENEQSTGDFYIMQKEYTSSQLNDRLSKGNPLAAAYLGKRLTNDLSLNPEFIFRYDILGT